jgi:hypothetical protein
MFSRQTLLTAWAGLSLMVCPVVLIAQSNGRGGDGIGTAQFTTDQSVTNFSANAQTIPYFRSSFTDPTNGLTYPYTMVGTNPAHGDAVTTIPTVVIPMRFTFTSSATPQNVLDGSAKVQDVLGSPVFQPADIGAAAHSGASAPPLGVAPNPRVISEPSDVTQLGDAIFRAEWSKTGSGYHVLLGQPQILPTVSFTVPQNQGVLVVGSRSHARIGLMSISWFSDRLNETMRAYHIPPNVLPIFLVYDTFLYIHSPGNCCVLGYHGATEARNGNGQQLVNTYMFAAYSEPGIFAANPGDNGFSYIQDIHALSHEVQEWYNDPFVNNAVDPWLTPTAPQYGCTGLLEVGDPVVGYGFSISMPNGLTYHPEDEVHFSWFARQSPSIAEQQYYTYLNNFANRAQGCN